ncbi:MAG: Gfo/Idh/MocA family oxidoreductase [Candidatus Saccharicenans sp.]|nr:Gfo/Idh/MocA family oxidoreductase [Candidatus Saccharicenans sp.]
MGQNKKNINWGILGAAAIAETTFIPAIKKSAQAELLAIASRNLDKARSWAKNFSLPRAYGSYEELLADPEIEAVYIPLPNHLHFEWTSKALRAGKHVLCEKPLALSAAEVKEMFAEAEKNGCLLMEGFMYRFHPRMARALNLIKSGAIGKPRLISSAFTFIFDRERSNYRWSPKMGGGALYDVGCYTINAARTIFEAEPDEALAVAHFDEQSGIDLTTSLLSTFPPDRQALLACSFELEFQSSLEIFGSQGRIFLDRAFSAKNLETEIQLTYQSKTDRIKFPPADQFQLMIEYFGEGIKGQVAPLIDFQDSYGNALVIEKVLKSIQKGQPSSM